MSISQFSVNRPVFISMVVLMVVVLGVVSLSRLSVDLMPDITLPTLSISTSYKRAAPEEIEELITRPIEEAVSTVSGVEKVTSVSAEGSSSVTVSFSWGTDIDAAANDVRDRLDRVIPRLPEEADRPVLRKFDLSSFPILILGVTGQYDPVQLRRLVEDNVKRRLERVAGVAYVDVWGGLEREIHVDINLDLIKALRLSLNQVLNRISAWNVELPAGSIERGNYEITIRTPGYYRNLEELRNTVIAERAGKPIYLYQIAEIRDAWQKETRLVRINGEPGVRIAVNKQSGANTVQVARGVQKEIARLNKEMPQLKIISIIDSSEFIQNAINNLTNSVLIGAVLTIVVLFLFLRNLLTTLIIAIAIPVSIIATFVMMYFGNFTLNLMTLGGIALGVGMMVDNSIVVLDNIFRLHETGKGWKQSAIEATTEVTSAIIASTLTTIVVFLPVVFARGMAGLLFKQAAYVMTLALMCSLFTALTVVPMMAGQLELFRSFTSVRDTSEGHFFEKLRKKYTALLRLALEHRLLVVFIASFLLAVAILFIPLVGNELMPQTDENEVRIDIEMEPGTKLQITDNILKKIEKIIHDTVPELKSIVASAGGPPYQASVSHVGFIRMALTKQSERKRSSQQIADALRARLSSIPGAEIRVRASSGLFILRRFASTTENIQIEIRGHDLNTATELANSVRKIVEGVRGVTDVQISRKAGVPEEAIVIDRARAADMKLTVQQVAETLETVLSGSTASYYKEAGDEYGILVKAKNAEYLPIDKILDITLINSDGEPVSLRNIVKVQPQIGPEKIERTDRERVITVSANISGRDMGSVIRDIQEELQAIPVPADFSIEFTGDYEEQQKAFKELFLALILAFLLVYMVMACQYESLLDPFVVMFSVPLAVIGVVGVLLLTGTTFNIYSYIGCTMLGGIVVNNAILLVDTANLLRRRDNMELLDAIVTAGSRRLRPIMMTSSTTILGLLPVAIGWGEGGETQAPLARVVIGGLLSSTVITLIVVPVVYFFFEKMRKVNKMR